MKRALVEFVVAACLLCGALLSGEAEIPYRFSTDSTLTSPIAAVASTASTSQASLPNVGSVGILLPDDL